MQLSKAKAIYAFCRHYLYGKCERQLVNYYGYGWVGAFSNERVNDLCLLFRKLTHFLDLLNSQLE